MAIIQPFQGYLPSSEMANKISSPPYDILSSDEARKIVFKNHYSFLRVIKPQTDFPAETNMGCDTIHKHGAKNLQYFIVVRIYQSIQNTKSMSTRNKTNYSFHKIFLKR